MLSTLCLLLLLGVAGTLGSQHFVDDEAVRQLSQANYDFSIELHKRLAKPNENMITSGFSVSTVLAMLLEGARGKSSNELLTALRYNDITPKNLEEAYRKVFESLKGDGSYDLNTANSLWVEKSFQILEAYKQKLVDVYQAEAKELNIPTGKDDINEWVSRKTQKLIPSLLDADLDTTTVMVLVNAIFFKGTWETKFNNKTFEAGFIDNDFEIPQDSKSATTKMMSTEGFFDYTESDDLEAYLVDLPYQGKNVSLTIVLPYSKLAELESDITTAKFQKAISSLKRKPVSVVMPVFKIESTHDLNSPLTNMGIQDIFADTANLTGINPVADIRVSKVLQKAFVEVDVEGTRAAAATSIEITGKSLGIVTSYIEFRATKPFLFAIRHRPTNTILFTGRYSQSTPYSE